MWSDHLGTQKYLAFLGEMSSIRTFLKLDISTKKIICFLSFFDIYIIYQKIKNGLKYIILIFYFLSKKNPSNNPNFITIYIDFYEANRPKLIYFTTFFIKIHIFSFSAHSASFSLKKT